MVEFCVIVGMVAVSCFILERFEWITHFSFYIYQVFSAVIEYHRVIA